MGGSLLLPDPSPPARELQEEDRMLAVRGHSHPERKVRGARIAGSADTPAQSSCTLALRSSNPGPKPGLEYPVV